MKFKFLFVVSCFFALKGQAQSVGYYPFSSMLSVATNPERAFWLDFRFQTNSYFSSLSTEVTPTINLNKNPLGRFYLGAGLRANPIGFFSDSDIDILEGYFVNIGVRSAPIAKFPMIQFAFELSPLVSSNFDSGLLRSRLGLAYNFSH